MTYDEMIAVIQAAKEGKAIQCRHHTRREWVTIPKPGWDFAQHEYRIKPEPPKPREVWVNFYENGNISAHLTEKASDSYDYSRKGGRAVLFREVLEDQK